MKRLLILAGALAMWVNAANAAIFVSWSGAAPVASGIWDWTYSVQLQPDQTMKVGDFATIYDVPNIAGFDPVFNPTFGPTVSDRTFSVITTPPVGLGLDPGPAVLGDDPLISNVSVQLTGGTHPGGNDIVGDPSAGPTIVGTLHIRSSSNQSILTDYLTIGHFGNAPSTTTGQVEVAAAIPEPGSLTLMVVGLLAAGGLVFRRRQM